MKNNKGITLIALVITIIVLLILAGITIAMLTGENGLLTKAKDAKEQADNAKEAFDKIHPQVKSATEQVASATEQVRLAVAAMNLELRTQLVTNSSYDPATAKDATDSTKNAMQVLLTSELKPAADWTVNTATTTGSGSSAKTTITVNYKNSEYVSAKGTTKDFTVVLSTDGITLE